MTGENYASTSKEPKYIKMSRGHERGRLMYETSYGTNFKVDGDLTKVLSIEYKGDYENNKEYVLHWIRDKLKKMENGQIKVVYTWESNKGERDWKQEEEIKQRLWEDINIEERPVGLYRGEIICTQAFCEQQEPYRPPSPTCKIS